MKCIEDASVTGKRVILRLALDVPMSESGEILDDERLRTSLQTIHYLKNRFAKIVIVGHLGRPKGVKVEDLSLRTVYLRLSALLKQPIHFAPNLFSEATAHAVNTMEEGQIVGLENLRFDKGEDANSRTFAKKLAKYGEVYVNDAFSAHHEAASTVAITEFLPSYAGLHLEQEVSMLQNLLKNPAKPFIAVIGGVKIADKLPAIKYIAQSSDKVLVGGAVANTFLAAEGVDVKKSLIDEKYLDQAKMILRRYRNKVILPVDYTWNDSMILDSGPKTTKLFKTYLDKAQTILWNGSLGQTEKPEFRGCSDAIAKIIADSPATTVVAGGNTIEIVSRLDLMDKISFVSSGGGAALTLLSGKKIPALEALRG